MVSPERRLCKLIAETQPSQVGLATSESTIRALVDTFAVGVAGSATPGAAQVRRAVVDDEHHGAGTWSGGIGLSPGSAALINGYQIHCLEFDCVHEPAVVHALSVVTAAVTSWAEHLGNVDGTHLLTAVAIGVDTAARLGVAAEHGLRFFRPATAGSMGAAAACGWLSRFDENRLLDVLGVAYSQVCGTMQAHVEASPMLPLQIGIAARAAVTSVELVQAGMEGPRDFLFGEFGYYTLIEQGGSPTRLLDGLGKRWLIDEISHKPFPSGRATHGAIVLACKLPSELVNAVEAIRQVTVFAPPLVVKLAGRSAHRDMEPPWARLCIPFLAAHAIRHGHVDLASFSPTSLRDPATLRLAARISVINDGNADENALAPQAMSIEFDDGSTIEFATEHLLGSPANPLDPEQLAKKVRDCMVAGGRSAASADALMKAVRELPQAANPTRLFALLRKEGESS